MSDAKELKVISLTSKVIIINKTESLQTDELIEEEVLIAPFFLDENQAIEDISELVDAVHQKFSEACEKLNLKWEAELEMGLEFGVKFSAKLKISPNKTQE